MSVDFLDLSINELSRRAQGRALTLRGVHLVEDVELLLGVETVGDGARVGVAHREDLHGAAVAVGGDQPAALVGELPQPVGHHLLHEHLVELGVPHHCDLLVGEQPLPLSLGSPSYLECAGELWFHGADGLYAAKWNPTQNSLGAIQLMGEFTGTVSGQIKNPWSSQDGKRIFFSVSSDGNKMYEATRGK